MVRIPGSLETTTTFFLHLKQWLVHMRDPRDGQHRHSVKVITAGRPPVESHTPPTDRESAEILCSGVRECSVSTAGHSMCLLLMLMLYYPIDLTKHKFQGTIMKNFGTVTTSS